MISIGPSEGWIQRCLADRSSNAVARLCSQWLRASLALQLHRRDRPLRHPHHRRRDHPRQARPLHDLTHYLVRAGTLLGSYSPEEAARLLTATDGPGARHLLALGLRPDAAVTHIRNYRARAEAATAAGLEFRLTFAPALP